MSVKELLQAATSVAATRGLVRSVLPGLTSVSCVHRTTCLGSGSTLTRTPPSLQLLDPQHWHGMERDQVQEQATPSASPPT